MKLGHPSSKGRIGIIAPYARGFSDSCIRLRLGSDGRMHLRLFGDGGIGTTPHLVSIEG
ncbi:hypothetical protein HQR01_12910 [Erythrobacter mangrovi]|uniref:Uncharacterized protein n=1 Tax=Erythrobacter mangrovi TaxID=2739433 RepID=A0A7D4BCL1_9SPHN|nr:hypothetical protein HQR01_12910 [Erythrobacter mangrovi]